MHGCPLNEGREVNPDDTVRHDARARGVSRRSTKVGRLTPTTPHRGSRQARHHRALNEGREVNPDDTGVQGAWTRTRQAAQRRSGG